MQSSRDRNHFFAITNKMRSINGSKKIMDSEMKEKCRVFGIFNHPNTTELTYYGLHALQHRGQKSAGIVASDGKTFRHHRGMGLVTQVFSRDTLNGLKGNMAVGHVRYSTSGASLLQNAQCYLPYHSFP
jgi:amidophosphoribosyltransferase